MQKKHSNGYTLVEMAIVILIISMLISVTLLGKDLIHNYKVNTIMSEYELYKSLVTNFSQKYQAFPGDIINATYYWYNATTCPGTTGTAGQCNGNNNGLIEENWSTDSDEAARAWQHLNLAGLTSFPSSGIGTGVGWTYTSGVGYPVAKFGYTFIWTFMNIQFYTNNNINSLLLIGSSYGQLTPLDAESIDSKIDDGIPKTGIVRGAFSNDPSGALGTGWASPTNCVVTATGLYNYQYTIPVLCSLQFEIQIM